MPEAIRSSLMFLVSAVFDIFLFILVLRMILVWVGAYYTNPAVQFVTKMTDWLIKPMRKVIPNYRQWESSSFVAILIIDMIKFLLLGLLAYKVIGNIGGLFVSSIADSFNMALNIFLYAIIAQVILSWLQPQSPLNAILNTITTPVLRPFQRIIGHPSGFDISPIPALILIQFLKMLIANPLVIMGNTLAFLA